MHRGLETRLPQERGLGVRLSQPGVPPYVDPEGTASTAENLSYLKEGTKCPSAHLLRIPIRGDLQLGDEALNLCM